METQRVQVRKSTFQLWTTKSRSTQLLPSKPLKTYLYDWGFYLIPVTRKHAVACTNPEYRRL